MIYQTVLFDMDKEVLNSRRRKSTNRFYEDIRKEYQKLRQKTKMGVRLYSDEYILQVLANKFYRSTKTIENIVFYRV